MNHDQTQQVLCLALVELNKVNIVPLLITASEANASYINGYELHSKVFRTNKWSDGIDTVVGFVVRSLRL